MKTLLTFLLLLVFSISSQNKCYAQQTTTSYKGIVYPVQTGPKEGRFIVLKDSTKHYLNSNNQITKTNGDEVIYKGNKYSPKTGSRGGKYIIVEGNKHYFK